jgi:hypothetical protein
MIEEKKKLYTPTPKDKDREYERLSLAALQTLLTGKSTSQLYVDIERHGDSYVIPDELWGLLANSGGTMSNIVTADGAPRVSNAGILHATETATNQAQTKVSATTGEIWEVLSILASLKADAGVANRALTVQVLPGLADATLASLSFLWDSNDPTAGDAVTVSASQYGIIWYTLGASTLKSFSVLSDNGTKAAVTSFPGKLYIRGASSNGGMVAVNYTNKQATDVSMISILYRVVGTGQ